MSQRVYVGLSGGVDSALAAALLVEQGYDVTAIYMRNWSRDLPGFHCPWAEDLADAERVAVQLGIDLKVWDCESEYKTHVVDYLVDAYARGLTPNPDVMCNQTIKFGSFLDRALAEGADLIATGHYARCITSPDAASAQLMRAADEHKDQTYFLWRVGADRLAKTLFPIGDISTKDEVRRMCELRGLGVASKPDSDGICFIGPVGLRNFLLDTLEPKAGEIIEWETGKILGVHDGAFLYTLGQRKGLNLGGGPARYVVRTDVAKNIVYVSSNQQCSALRSDHVLIGDCRWIDREPPMEGTYLVRTRHTAALKPARLVWMSPGAAEAYEYDKVEGKAGNMGHEQSNGKAYAQIVFEHSEEIVAPGQSVVIYDGLRCCGGGIALPSPDERL